MGLAVHLTEEGDLVAGLPLRVRDLRLDPVLGCFEERLGDDVGGRAQAGAEESREKEGRDLGRRGVAALAVRDDAFQRSELLRALSS